MRQSRHLDRGCYLVSTKLMTFLLPHPRGSSAHPVPAMFIRMIFSLKTSLCHGNGLSHMPPFWQQKAGEPTSKAACRRTLEFLDIISSGYIWADQLQLQGGGRLCVLLMIPRAPTLNVSPPTSHLRKHSVHTLQSQFHTSLCAPAHTVAQVLCEDLRSHNRARWRQVSERPSVSSLSLQRGYQRSYSPDSVKPHIKQIEDVLKFQHYGRKISVSIM